MKSILFMLLVAQAPSANPLSDGARLNYGIIKNFLTRAAAKMPEQHYAFQPTPDVRTFAQFVGHLADANYRVCSVADGEAPVDSNGTLRLVLSNKDRMHPGVMDGKMINRPRPVAGLLFFNDEGDEVGGLTFTGQERDGKGRASGTFTFDQWKQDQTIGILYNEDGGQRMAGLQVWDRPETRLSELIEKLNAANAIQDPAERNAALQAARAGAQPGPQRLFVGKGRDRAATIMLADAAGKPRLSLKVQPDGTAAIEFLDAQGEVTDRLPK